MLKITILHPSSSITASGIREWADITHKDGAWLSWQEIKSKYMPYGTDADEQEYRAVIDDLNGGRWEGVRRAWIAAVRGGSTAVEAFEPAHDRVYDVDEVVAARKTAPCNGGSW